MFLINTQAIPCVSMCTRQTPGHHPLHSYRHLYSKQCEPAVCINGYFYNVYNDILLLTSRNFVPRDPLSENTVKKFMSAGNKKWNLQGAGGEFPYQYAVQFFQKVLNQSTFLEVSLGSKTSRYGTLPNDFPSNVQKLSTWVGLFIVHSCSVYILCYQGLLTCHEPTCRHQVIVRPQKQRPQARHDFLSLQGMLLHERHLTCVSSRLASWRVKWLRPFAWTPMVSIKQIPSRWESRWKIRFHKFGFPSGGFGFPELN